MEGGCESRKDVLLVQTFRCPVNRLFIHLSFYSSSNSLLIGLNLYMNHSFV